MKIKYILPILSAVNLVLLVLLWVCERFVAEHNWLTTLLTYMPQQAFASGVIVLGIWALWRRNRLAIALTALSTVLLIFVLLGFNVPLASGGGAGPSFRILSYNIDGSRRGGSHVAEIIKALNPDIICLQEAQPVLRWSDAITEIHRALPKYHFADCWELASFSRYPIIQNQWHLIQPESGRNLQQLTISVNGRPITVFTYHMGTAAWGQSVLHNKQGLGAYLSESARIRMAQIGLIRDYVEAAHGPVVVVGDFNTPPRGFVYGTLARHFKDSFRAAGSGFGYTFSSDCPMMRIDYIWAGPGLGVKHCWSPGSAASDHRPLVADLVLTK